MTEQSDRVPIDARCRDALEVALDAAALGQLDAGAVQVARTLTARLDEAVAEGATPNAIAALGKEVNACLAALGLTPMSRRKVVNDGDPLERLLAGFDGPAPRERAER
jgi:hypothetical protein